MCGVHMNMLFSILGDGDISDEKFNETWLSNNNYFLNWSFNNQIF